MTEFDPTAPLENDAPDPEGGAIPVARPVLVDGQPWTIPAPPPLPDDPMLLRNMRRGSTVVDVFIIVVLVVAAEFVTGVILGVSGAFPPESMSKEAEAEFNRTILVPVLAVRASAVLGLVWLILRGRGQSWQAVGLTGRSWFLNVLLGAAGAAVAWFLSVAYALIVVTFFPSLEESLEENAVVLTEIIPHLSPAAFAMLAIVVGFYEELMVRGFILPRLRRLTSSWIVAVILSTALFVAPHAADQTPPTMVPIAILSIIFSILTIWRRSLIPAIAGHVLFNYGQFLFLSAMFGDQWK